MIGRKNNTQRVGSKGLHSQPLSPDSFGMKSRIIASTTAAGIVGVGIVGLVAGSSAQAAWDADNRAGQFSVGQVLPGDATDSALNEIGAYRLSASTAFSGAFAFCALEGSHQSPTGYSGDYTQERVTSWTGSNPVGDGTFEPTKPLNGRDAAAIAYINSRVGVAITEAAGETDPNGPGNTRVAILKMAQIVAADAVTPDQEAFVQEHQAEIDAAWQEALDHAGSYTASVTLEDDEEDGWQLTNIGVVSDATGEWYPNSSRVQLEVSGTANPTFDVAGPTDPTNYEYISTGGEPAPDESFFINVEDPDGSIEVTVTFEDMPTSEIVLLRAEDNAENLQPLAANPLRDDSRSQNLFLLGQTEEVSATATRAAVVPPVEPPVVVPPVEPPVVVPPVEPPVVVPPVEPPVVVPPVEPPVVVPPTEPPVVVVPPTEPPVVVVPPTEEPTVPPVTEQAPAGEEAEAEVAAAENLATTGSGVSTLVGIGSALLLAGGASLLVARRIASN
jgi:hypothetical protein